jgi:glyoxylase-like metal-dependent hydrolase (beta-lactamase superfamily II)
MKRAGTMLALSLAIAMVVVACASMSGGGRDHVARAVSAQGGTDALTKVKTVSQKATVRQWAPEQSQAAGGEMRFANQSTVESITDVTVRATRTEWVRDFQYPAPRKFTFSEVVTAEAGYVAGIDSNGRTKQSQESTPPAHTMSGQRLATAQRELARSSPLLALEMAQNPDRVSAAPDVTVSGVTYKAATYRVGAQTLIVMFDPSTGLPARVRSLDYDNIWGDVTYDLVLSDWQVVEGVRVATTQKYELNGRMVMESKVTETRVNLSVAADRFQIPAAYLTGAPRPATERVPVQWVMRRQFIGAYLDSDVPSYDTRASRGLRLAELGPGVQYVVGGTHNSLIVEMKDYLVVFDSPVSDWQSNWTLSAAHAKYLKKPVKYLVLTHHHMDHAGGLRAYASDGVTIVAGPGTAEHWKRVLAAPFTRNPDLGSQDLSRTPIVEVADKWTVTDGQRQVEAYVIAPNPHADGMLIGYVVDQKLAYVTDIWIPGAPLGDKLNPAQAALVAGVKKAGIQPAKFAGGHGSTADYATLTALDGK